MGRNRQPFTGHTELRTSFSKKGGMKRGDNGAEVRMMLTYTQVQHKEGTGFIYMIDYDGQIFYNVFKERYDTNSEGGTTTLYPGEVAFRENKYQWAYCTNTLDEAKEILNNFENIFEHQQKNYIY